MQKTFETEIPQVEVDEIQRTHIEKESKQDQIAYLMSMNATNEEFLNSEIFKAYEKKYECAFVAYQQAQENIKEMYIPAEVSDKLVKWSLDYKTCVLTYTVEE